MNTAQWYSTGIFSLHPLKNKKRHYKFSVLVWNRLCPSGVLICQLCEILGQCRCRARRCRTQMVRRAETSHFMKHSPIHHLARGTWSKNFLLFRCTIGTVLYYLEVLASKSQSSSMQRKASAHFIHGKLGGSRLQHECERLQSAQDTEAPCIFNNTS